MRHLCALPRVCWVYLERGVWGTGAILGKDYCESETGKKWDCDRRWGTVLYGEGGWDSSTAPGPGACMALQGWGSWWAAAAGASPRSGVQHVTWMAPSYTRLGRQRELRHQTGNAEGASGMIRILASPLPSHFHKYLCGWLQMFHLRTKEHHSFQFQIIPNLLLVIKPMTKASIFRLSRSQNQMRLCSARCAFLIKATAYPLAVGRHLL